MVKIESVPYIKTFGLKMMVKRGSKGFVVVEIPQRRKLFKGKIFAQTTNSVTKITFHFRPKIVNSNTDSILTM